MSEQCTLECCTAVQRDERCCPSCGKKGSIVGIKTILLHIHQPWRHELTGNLFYFCKTQTCEVVYFSAGDQVFYHSDVRTRIGQKSHTADALLCYCFGITRQAAECNKEIKEFVIGRTRAGMCACEAVNPSGRCCLKEFPSSDG